MKYFLPLTLLLLSCTKDYSSENAPVASIQPQQQTIPVPAYSKVVLVGLPQPKLSDSLAKSLQTVQVPYTDATSADFNLDQATHDVIAAPVGKGLIIADVISQDVYANRSTPPDYVARAEAFKDAWEAAGWTVLILKPAGRAVDGETGSGMTEAEYRAALAAVTVAMPNAVDHTNKAIMAKVWQ